jgi:hypothetical protein
MMSNDDRRREANERDTKVLEAAMVAVFAGTLDHVPRNFVAAAVYEGSPGQGGIRFMRLQTGTDYDWANTEMRLYSYKPLSMEKALNIVRAFKQLIDTARAPETSPDDK